MKYKTYLHDLMNESIEESGNVISPDQDNREFNDIPGRLKRRQNPGVDEEEESKMEGSYLHSDINNANSQHVITHNNRHDTYKSMDTARDKLEDHKNEGLTGVMNIYKKKKINVAMLPAVFHIITKKDMLSDQGFEDQLGRAKALKEENVIDQFFFISSKDNEGIMQFLEAINDRRLDILRQDQDEKDSIRHASEM